MIGTVQRTFHARRDGGVRSIMAAFFAQLGFAEIIGMVYFLQSTMKDLAIAFGCAIVVSTLFALIRFESERRVVSVR